MRVGGWAFALGAIVAIAITGPVAAACDDGTGCEDTAKSIAANQAATEAAAAETQAETAEKPLPLVTPKSSKPRSAHKAAPRKAAAPKPAADEAGDTVKNARAEARDSEMKKTNDSTLTDADRGAAPAPDAMPALSPDGASEIDQAAVNEIAPVTPASANVAQQTEPNAAPKIAQPAEDDRPRLAAARVELPESTTVASSAGQTAAPDSTWGSTSTLGKIFIALGGLLTAASAVRMFIG
jgi:hypothetical protein